MRYMARDKCMYIGLSALVNTLSKLFSLSLYIYVLLYVDTGMYIPVYTLQY